MAGIVDAKVHCDNICNNPIATIAMQTYSSFLYHSMQKFYCRTCMPLPKLAREFVVLLQNTDSATTCQELITIPYSKTFPLWNVTTSCDIFTNIHYILVKIKYNQLCSDISVPSILTFASIIIIMFLIYMLHGFAMSRQYLIYCGLYNYTEMTTAAIGLSKIKNSFL